MIIALLGCGTVGGGLIRLLTDRQDIEILRVLVHRPHPELSIPCCFDISEILDDPSIELVAEAMGGLHPAYEYVSAALTHGKHVVTANKQLMAAYYSELTALARENGVSLRCTAAAGGGISWLSELADTAALDSIRCICGIMNGTTNYILTRMRTEGADFADVLADAQRLGYAETDPSADIDGYDVRRKLLLSANIAFGVSLREEDIPTVGIRNIRSDDIRSFTEAGLTCRLIGCAEQTERGITASVLPTLFPFSAPESTVNGCMNRMTLHTVQIGSRAFYGEGAGALPTASNMLRDCIAIRNGCAPFYCENTVPAASQGPENARYYIRTDRPGAFPVERSLGNGYVTAPAALSELLRADAGISFLAQLFQNAEEQS